MVYVVYEQRVSICREFLFYDVRFRALEFVVQCQNEQCTYMRLDSKVQLSGVSYTT